VTRAPITSGFGWEWRKAAYQAVAPRDASRLAAVFVDFAYTNKSSVFEASERTLSEAAGISYGRSFDRAEDWLIDHGFLEKLAAGGSHRATVWQLVMPGEATPAQERANTEPPSPAHERAKPSAGTPATTPASRCADTPATSHARMPAQERALPEPSISDQARQARPAALIEFLKEQGRDDVLRKLPDELPDPRTTYPTTPPERRQEGANHDHHPRGPPGHNADAQPG
jgi:hypothetical protein